MKLSRTIVGIFFFHIKTTSTPNLGTWNAKFAWNSLSAIPWCIWFHKLTSSDNLKETRFRLHSHDVFSPAGQSAVVELGARHVSQDADTVCQGVAFGRHLESFAAVVEFPPEAASWRIRLDLARYLQGLTPGRSDDHNFVLLAYWCVWKNK